MSIWLVIVAVLLFALAGSLCGNLWLAGELERIHREEEEEWGDPDLIREVDEE